MDIAGGTRRDIKLLHHCLYARDPLRILGPDHDAVGAPIRDDDDPRRRVGRGGLRARPCTALREQPAERLRHIRRRRVAQRYHHRLAAAGPVQRVDDPVDTAQVGRVIRDHEGIVAGIGDDGIGRADNGPQHGQQLVRGRVLERIDLRQKSIATGRIPRRHRAQMHLGVGFQHDLRDAIAFDRGEALQSQRGQENVVDGGGGNRPRGDDIDRALDARIDEEIALGDLPYRRRNRLQIGVDEIERDFFIRGFGDRSVGRQHDQQRGERAPKNDPQRLAAIGGDHGLERLA